MNERRNIIAVVTAADCATGLGTARALRIIRQSPIKIIGLCTKPRSSFCKSHVWDKLVVVGNEPENFVEQLITIGRSLLPATIVLLPTQDHAVRIISEYRSRLEDYFHFVLPCKKVVDLLLDKIAFHFWAEERGFPLPESYLARTEDELEDILNRVEYPIIIKPSMRTIEWDRKSPGDKVFKLQEKADWKKIGFNVFEVADGLLVQRWIPGPDSNIHFCLTYVDRRGDEVAHYTGRKLVQWPVGQGSTAICVGAPNNEVHELTREVFMAARMVGIGSLEVKRSEKDGKYYIMEPTVARNNLQSYVAVAGGVNLTWLAVTDAFGARERANHISSRKAMWVEEYHTIQVLLGSRRRHLQWGEIMRSLRGRVAFAYFQFGDPMPFIGLLKTMLVRKVRGIYRWLGRCKSRVGWA